MATKRISKELQARLSPLSREFLPSWNYPRFPAQHRPFDVIWATRGMAWGDKGLVMAS
jgi:hypothetical protein